MYTRFTNIMNEFEGLGKVFSNEEMINKILRSLPKTWDPKTTAIEEAKNVETMRLEELVGSLITFELKMKKKETEEKEAPREDSKKKSIAFKAQDNGSGSENEKENLKAMREDIYVLTRKFKKFTRSNRRDFQTEKSSRKEKEDEKKDNDELRCFRCHKLGHVRSICPLKKHDEKFNKRRRKDKKKSFSATYDGLSCSTGSEESDGEVSHIYLVGIQEDDSSKEVNSLSSHNVVNNDEDENIFFTYDDLYDACEKFQEAHILEVSKNIKLMKEIEKLNLELEKSKKECNALTCIECLSSNSTLDKWYLDSGCSRHMTFDPSKFSTLNMEDQGTVTFGDNAKGKIIGEGTIKFKGITIKNVLLVDGLRHNLLSISQLSDNGNEVFFKNDKCIVRTSDDNETEFEATRDGNVYTFMLEELICQNVTCLVSFENNTWTWHRRLGHSNMEIIARISGKNIVDGLPKLNYFKNHLCRACQLGKEVKDSFQHKNIINTSRPLQRLLMDLFGPVKTCSFGGKRYVFVVVDDFSRFT
ncbi:uncharacterized protein LOC143869726 [Tasmannia lanceolata]|uniref:uncharacterized protein LOC143869726 n=1 Tax=Tasmannia lanceolata TaxID=3420 RepID=UPI0040646816